MGPDQNAVGLTAEQIRIVKYFEEKTEPLSQKYITEVFGIAQPNVSGYCFKALKEAGIIEEKKGTGKPAYWQFEVGIPTAAVDGKESGKYYRPTDFQHNESPINVQSKMNRPKHIQK